MLVSDVVSCECEYCNEETHGVSPVSLYKGVLCVTGRQGPAFFFLFFNLFCIFCRDQQVGGQACKARRLRA